MNSHSFLEPHSRAIRLWHWAFVLFISATISIVILASTLLRTGTNIPLVEQQLAEKGVTVNEDQARSVAHSFNDELWDVHRWIGYGLCILLVCRWFIERAQPRSERLNNKVRRAAGFRSVIPIEQDQARHYLVVKTIYLVFYGVFVAMALSGLIQAFNDIQVLDQYQDLAKQLHSFLQWPIYFFIFIHLVGVIRADLGYHKGLVSGMIHGQRLG